MSSTKLLNLLRTFFCQIDLILSVFLILPIIFQTHYLFITLIFCFPDVGCRDYVLNSRKTLCKIIKEQTEEPASQKY